MTTADDIARGVSRLMVDRGYAPLGEVSLKTGRRVDIMAIGPKGEICVVEIKSSREDFMTDRKWHEYLEYADTFYFAVAAGFPLELLPDDEGLIIADGYHGEIVRASAEHPLPAARRKALLLRFARTAAHRARRYEDPGLPALLP
ncbi:MAG: MmcB family DNA repair protein [Geminicoccaceae bacterium]|nr:MmcB family DNA repair protein [Geminicoccaceae bacterium]MCB2009343.1 MmcB family DNA repair protein [Geminicoccaceae bacterium]